MGINVSDGVAAFSIQFHSQDFPAHPKFIIPRNSQNIHVLPNHVSSVSSSNFYQIKLPAFPITARQIFPFIENIASSVSIILQFYHSKPTPKFTSFPCELQNFQNLPFLHKKRERNKSPLFPSFHTTPVL